MSRVRTISICVASLIAVIFILTILPRQATYFNVAATCAALAHVTSETLGALTDPDLPPGPVYTSEDNVLFRPRDVIGAEAMSILGTIPNLRAVNIVDLAPQATTPKAMGMPSFANYTVRCVLPIECPRAQRAGMWNADEERKFEKNKWILYDDGNLNYHYNDSKTARLRLLIVDIDRPACHRIGTGGATDINASRGSIWALKLLSLFAR